MNYLKSISGIDVSQWQGEIDWDAVARAGIRFAFMKATEGATWNDPAFVRNRDEAQRVGIAAGAYHYFRSSSKVLDQAESFARAVGELREGELPPALDVEEAKQWQGLSRKELTGRVLEWLQAVEERLGARPFVYLSPSFAETLLDGEDARLGSYPLWLAHWTEKGEKVPKPWKAWTFWQYSSKGVVNGISANVVDLDRFHGSEDEFRKLIFRNPNPQG